MNSQPDLYLKQSKSIKYDNGLFMEGYYIWGGSVLKSEGIYHMFASRWPNSSFRAGNNELDGYRTASEIVRAESLTPEGPYVYKQTVIGKRDENYWDSQMAHNPYIIKINDKYVLFYIGIKKGDIRRKVGCAVSDTIDGDFVRSETEIQLTDDANNPAPYILNDGSIAVIFRDRDLNVYTAVSKSCDQPFKIIDKNMFKHQIEDFCIYNINGVYHMICEDNAGKYTNFFRYGVHFISKDGVSDWVLQDKAVYHHTLNMIDGKAVNLKRRERPQLLFDDDKIYLVTSALMQEGWSKCIVVPVENAFL